MSWNYRVCRESHPYKIGDLEGVNVVYGIHEAYYNKAGEVWAVTENPISLLTDTSPGNCEDEEECMDALRQQHTWMALALDKPVLDLDTIVYASPDEIEDDDDE